jgi:hypothetical protein
MKEALAVTGYVEDKVAQHLRALSPGKVDVRPERGVHDVLMRVDGADVAEVRTGSSAHGETLVQLILRDGAAVETVVRAVASAAGVARLNDPALIRLTAAATAKQIMV